MKRILFLSLLLTVLVVWPAEAQRKAGRTGAAFLEVGIGAREVALGSAVTALAGNAGQIFWNPAGTALTENRRGSVSFSYIDWIADIEAGALAAGYRTAYGTVTLGVQYFGLSDIPANRQNGYTDPILQGLVTDTETSPTFDYTDLAVSVSYARYVLDRLSLGATVKYINERIDGVGASALAFDFGSVYRVGVAGWQIAARLSNLGTDMSFFNQDNPLPLVFSIGSTIYPVNREQMRLMLAIDTTKPLDSQQLLYGGAELSFYDLLFLRAGYRFNYAGAEDGGTSTRDPIKTSIEGISLGAGLQYALGDYALGFDYAFTQMDLLDDVHRFTLRIGM
jgi:hypothetical protein